MRVLLVATVLAAWVPAFGDDLAAAGGEGQPVGSAEGIFTYRFERGDLRYGDILTSSDGSQRLGKAMAWADQVLLFEADGRPIILPVADVDQIEFRRAERHKTRPNVPDLTVAYIERLPRDPSWHGHVDTRDGLQHPGVELVPESWHPVAGAEVTFRIHVLNAGGAKSKDVGYRVLIDDGEIGQGRIPALSEGGEHVVDVKWSWQMGRHTLHVEVDPDHSLNEIVRWNNSVKEATDALGITVVVAADRHAAFREVANIVDSFCFEDWIQYQVRTLNGLFAASIHPSAPRGIEERVRCDRIVLVDDPAAAAGRARWESTLHKDGKPDEPAEFAALWVFGRLGEDDTALHYDALKVDWAGLQAVAGQLGLVDLAVTDTTVEQCFVQDKHGRYAQRRHIFPQRRTMMYAAGGFAFDERSAAFLNQVRGRPRGFQGDFLYQVPKKITLEVRSNAGTPLADVQVEAFQLMTEGEHAGVIAGYGREDPLYSATTGADGRLTLVDLPAGPHSTPGGYELRANPFGKIATDGLNGLLLLRLRFGGSEEFHFLRLFDCNIAYLHGRTEEYLRLVGTRFAVPGSPTAPAYAAIMMEDRSVEYPRLNVVWPFPAGMKAGEIEEFRVYRRTSFGGDDARPWTLVSVVGRKDGQLQRRCEGAYFEENRDDGLHSLDTFYAVSTVDRQGRESHLSETGFIAYDKDSVKLVLDDDEGAAYVTLVGDGPCQMIRWDGVAGMQPFGIRTRRFPRYSPSYAGIAKAADGRLVVADPVNHVLAFYERGDLVELVPQRKWWPGFASDEPGEFYAPADVAVDEAGNIYVADPGNDRVQILDSGARFKAMLDEGFRFDAPHAVGYGNGHLCVTDRSGSRCRVYDVGSGDGGVFVRELPPLADADRGIVGKSGNVYISGRDERAGVSGILVYTPKGESAVYSTVGIKGAMGKYHQSRGMCLYKAGNVDWAYFVNEFPFDVRRYAIP